MKYFQLITIINLIINIANIPFANSKTNTPFTQQRIHYLYKTAQKELYHAHYQKAIEDLIKLQNLYLFHPYPQQINLDLIYAYYKSNDLKSTNNFIKKFLHNYPNHKNLDYVLYMHGIVNMRLDQNNKKILKYLNINWFDRNPSYAYIAFQSFLKLIHDYPKSQYYLDSYKRLIFLKNRIAEYELSIIKFYYNKHSYLSVINRAEKMMCCFSDVSATRKALLYMQKAYENTHLYTQSNKIKKIIIANST